MKTRRVLYVLFDVIAPILVTTANVISNPRQQFFDSTYLAACKSFGIAISTELLVCGYTRAH